jgi:hypothetical protein
MRKLLYVIPFILIGLSLTPFALYKDNVNYGNSLDSLSPSHWKILNLQLSFSGSVDSTQSQNPNEPLPEPEPVSKDASFKGFPFGAYFSRSETSQNGNFNASGYSWLWAGIDLLLIIASLIISFTVNRIGKSTASVSQSGTTPTAITPQTHEVNSTMYSSTERPRQIVQPADQQNSDPSRGNLAD